MCCLRVPSRPFLKRDELWWFVCLALLLNEMVTSGFIVQELAALTLGIFSASAASLVSLGFFQTAFGAKTNKILSLSLTRAFPRRTSLWRESQQIFVVLFFVFKSRCDFSFFCYLSGYCRFALFSDLFEALSAFPA